jgi:hypothetical protein
VLDYKAPSQVERVVAGIRADLESGTPLQMARTKLVNSGIDAESALKLVAAAATAERRTCATCKLSFIASVQKCSACGGALNDEPLMDVLPSEG